MSEVMPGLKAPSFEKALQDHGLDPLRAKGIEILQVNVGKLCNQACRHCHVDAGPTRREIMTRETFELCLAVIQKNQIPTVDLTGGAPEMNPEFRWFVEECRKLGCQVMVRCNLTILTAGARFEDLPDFFTRNGVEVVSSLPHYTKGWTDRQRGDHVFEKSIEGLKRLNRVGYGQEGSGLALHLVYNPVGAFLPGNQAELEADYKRELATRFGIRFNRLFTITNMPIARFREALEKAQQLEDYLDKLVAAFNPAAVAGVMCRTLVSVGWDGKLYDCDFNQMLELPVVPDRARHIRDFDAAVLGTRKIALAGHCFGCTAGAGSSCGGATT